MLFNMKKGSTILKFRRICTVIIVFIMVTGLINYYPRTNDSVQAVETTVSQSNIIKPGTGESGGGFTSEGVKGEYFANNNLSGTSSFTRNDVRIDFLF